MKALEDYRKYWKQARLDSASLEAGNKAMARRLAAGKAMTAKQSLGRHYLFSFIVSLLLPVLSPVLIIVGFPMWIAVVYGIFGIIMAVLNGMFFSYIRKIDYYSLPTVDALKNAMKLSRRNMIMSIAGFSMACAVSISMLSASLDGMHDNYFYGLIAGLLIGILIGFLRFRSKNRLTRKLRDELRSISAE